MVIALAVILAVLLLAVGGEQGLKSFFATIINLFLMVGYVIAVAKGVPIWPVTVVAVISFMAITLFYQFGVNKKTVVAMISSFAVLLVATGGIIWFVSGSRIAGLNEVDLSTDMSQSISNNVGLDMTTVMVIVVLLGTLGAVVDTAMSVATALYEIKQNHLEISFASLIKSGWQVGSDILGTTVNTLAIAGLGELFMLGIFFILNEFSLSRILNSEAIFQEMATILIGSSACILVIPLTNLLMSRHLDKHGI